MYHFFICSAFLLFSNIAASQTPDSTQTPLFGTFENPIIVTNDDSVQYFVGRVISIKGWVATAKKIKNKDGVMGFLNISRPFPDNPFSAVIYRDAFAFFDPLEQYAQKKVRITGEVRFHKDKVTGKDRYSIPLRKLKQIEILD